MGIKFDKIGYWSEIKLEILREYASAYSRILSAQTNPSFRHVYVDAFAGAGLSKSRRTGEFIKGSPLNALSVDPPFHEYHFIDIDRKRVEALTNAAQERNDVTIHEGDCNSILLEKVFPRINYEQYRRGLCILDPYGLQLNWEILREAGQMKTIDIFLNFSVMDINRNVLWRDVSRVSGSQRDRLTRFWGDETWRKELYDSTGDLFEHPSKIANADVAKTFKERLRKVAGFKRVVEPIPMRNSTGGIVYYLFFASQKDVAEHIVTDIFNKYRDRM